MKKFYFLLCALMVAIAANAADYYLIGNFNEWALKDANAKFEDQGDGTFVLDYAGTLTSGFKINDGTWSNDAANFGGSATLVVGETYNLEDGGASGNIKFDGNIENPHIVFNPTAKTLHVTGKSVEAKVKYGIHGTVFGDPDWSTTDMTEVDGKWVVTADCVKGDFGVKVMDAATGTQTGWFNSASGSAVVLGEAMPCVNNGANWNLATNGNYTFTFDPEAKTLVISKVGGAEETFEYVLVLNDGEENAETFALENAGNNEYTVTIPNLTMGTVMFKAIGSNGTVVLYGAEEEGDAFADYNANGTFFVAEGSTYAFENYIYGKCTFTFNPVNGTVKIKKPLDIAGFVMVTSMFGEDFGQYQFEDNGNGIYSYTGEAIKTDNEIMFGYMTSSYDMMMLVPAGGSAILSDETVGTPIELTEGYEGSAASTLSGNYKFTFDSNAMTLTVSKASVETFNIYFKNTKNWETPHIHYWGVEESIYPGVAMTQHDGDIWFYQVPEGTTSILFNAGDGDATKTEDFVALKGHLYTTEGDQGEFNGETPVEMPEALYIIGNLGENNNWNTNGAIAMTLKGNVYSIKQVTIVPEGDNKLGYFSFISKTGADWNEVNTSDRFGAPDEDAEIEANVTTAFVDYPANVSASAAKSWGIAPGTYDFTLDFANHTLTVTKTGSGIEDIENADNVAPVYYNLQGVQVETPSAGLYIEVRGNQIRKVIIK